MPLTRHQLKKLMEAEKQNSNSIVVTNRDKYSTSVHFNPVIDFIDASKEWRKNKKKCENCTFEYIFI